MIGQPPASRFCKLGTALALVAMCAGFTGQVAAQTANSGDTSISTLDLGTLTPTPQPTTLTTTDTSGILNPAINLPLTLPATSTGSTSTSTGNASIGAYTASNGTTTSGTGFSPTNSVTPGCAPTTVSSLNGQASNALGNNASIINARMTKANPIWSGCNLQTLINMYDNLMSLFTGFGGFSLADLGDYIMSALVTAACNLVSTAVQGAINTGLSALGSTGIAGNIASNALGGALYGGQQGAVNGLTNGVGNAISTVTGNSLGGMGISLTPTGILNQATSGSTSTLTGAVQGPSTQTVLQNLQSSLFGGTTTSAPATSTNTTAPVSDGRSDKQ